MRIVLMVQTIYAACLGTVWMWFNSTQHNDISCAALEKELVLLQQECPHLIGLQGIFKMTNSKQPWGDGEHNAVTWLTVNIDLC